MKYPLSLFLMIFSNFIFGQTYIVYVESFQNFSHPYGMSISRAIREDKFIYEGSYLCDAKYIINLDSGTFHAHLGDGEHKTGEIVQKFETSGYFAVEASVGGRNFICKLYLDNDGNPIFTIEWVDGDWVKGFFTGKMKMEVNP